MLIKTYQTSKKTKKQKAKVKAIKLQYGQTQKSAVFKPLTLAPLKPLRPGADDFRSCESVDSGGACGARKDTPRYTGTNMIGIGTLHKSNAVPVFKGEDAVDLAKMRR